MSNKLSCYLNLYCLGAREKNFKILYLSYFASSLTKLWLSIGLWGFGNVLANLDEFNQSTFFDAIDAIDAIMTQFK